MLLSTSMIANVRTSSCIVVMCLPLRGTVRRSVGYGPHMGGGSLERVLDSTSLAGSQLVGGAL